MSADDGSTKLKLAMVTHTCYSALGILRWEDHEQHSETLSYQNQKERGKKRRRGGRGEEGEGEQGEIQGEVRRPMFKS